jgi:hypothetical protein
MDYGSASDGEPVFVSGSTDVAVPAPPRRIPDRAMEETDAIEPGDSAGYECATIG